MSRDRREELTRRLDELEATVRGLTEELVEVHARLNELEAQVEPDLDSDSTASSRSGVSKTEAPTSSEDVRSNERTTATKASPSDASTHSEGTDSEETGSEDSDLDDIIVA